MMMREVGVSADVGPPCFLISQQNGCILKSQTIKRTLGWKKRENNKLFWGHQLFSILLAEFFPFVTCNLKAGQNNFKVHKWPPDHTFYNPGLEVTM